MALTKNKKIDLIAEYTAALKGAKSAVYVSYKGLPVKKQEILRKKLFALGMNYSVVKKSLWDRAATANNVTGTTPVVGGEMGVVFGDDLIVPAREAYDFAKANKGVFAILGGVWDGAFMDAKAMMEIALTPSREVSISKIAYLFKSPMQRLAIGLSEVAKTKSN